METIDRPSIQAVVCPDCGNPSQVATIGKLTIRLCLRCRDGALHRERQAKAEEVERKRLEALTWARMPQKYQRFSLDVVLDWRDVALPPVADWPTGATLITNQVEREVIDRLRGWQPAPNGGWAMLEGPPGQGKSHLVAAWLNDLIRTGYRGALWLSEREVALLYASDYGSKSKIEASELLTTASRCRLLVWDDWGFTGRPDLSSNVLGLRYERGLPTVLTTNLTKEVRQGLLRNDTPTASRLAEMLAPARGGWHVLLSGPDKRRHR